MPDVYQLPNGTLKNRLNETNSDRLAKREGHLVTFRDAALRARGVGKPLDTSRLLGIHAFLFQDVYWWAGEVRTVDLSKKHFVDGEDVTHFAPAREIERRMRDLDAKLKASDYLRGRDRPTFARDAASLFVALNNLHPFREGNGRTQRFFLEAIALQAGHPLYFDVVSKERMISVSISGSQKDLEPARRLMTEISDPERVTALRKAQVFLRQAEGSFADMYLATTVAGQRYDGKLIGRAGSDFMIHVDTPVPAFIVGDIDDLDPSAENDERVTFTPKRF